MEPLIVAPSVAYGIALQTQICFSYEFFLKKLFTVSCQGNPPIFQHVCPISYLQGLLHILLNQEDGNALVTESLYDVKDFLHDERRQTT